MTIGGGFWWWGVRVFGLVDIVAGRVGYVASRRAQVVVGVKEGRKRETMSVGLVLRGAMVVLLGWRACVCRSRTARVWNATEPF